MSDPELERVATRSLTFTQDQSAPTVDEADGRSGDNFERVTFGHHAGADGAVAPSPARGHEKGRG